MSRPSLYLPSSLGIQAMGPFVSLLIFCVMGDPFPKYMCTSYYKYSKLLLVCRYLFWHALQPSIFLHSIFNSPFEKMEPLLFYDLREYSINFSLYLNPFLGSPIYLKKKLAKERTWKKQFLNESVKISQVGFNSSDIHWRSSI